MPINLIEIRKLVLPDDPKVGPKILSYLAAFQEMLLDDIKVLNSLIDTYNQASTQDELISDLDVLAKAMAKIDRKYPDNLKSSVPDYHEKIHKNLFASIQTERMQLMPVHNLMSLSFEAYLASMEPEKVDQLLLILLEPNFSQEKLKSNLFADGEVGRDGFMQLLSNYEIEFFLGNNCKNFKVLDKNTNKVSILKVDNRLNTPKDAVDHLRAHTMSDVFTPDISEREAMCINPVDGKVISRTLLFTEFHPAGDLKNDGIHQVEDEKISSAIHRYIQMATVLEKIEQDGCCFTDMKNGNWLVDDFGELRIADKKSFLFTHEVEEDTVDEYGDPIKKTIKVLDLNDPKNRFYSLPLSRQMSPPELETLRSTKAAIDVNKMHAFMLGKNLYQYLTNCEDTRFFAGKKDGVPIPLHSADQLDFSADLFLTAKGMALQHTIKQLIVPDPGARKTTLNDTIEALAFIEYPDLVQFSFTHSSGLVRLKIDTYQLLKGLEQFKINSQDLQVISYINNQLKMISASETEESLMSIRAEITAMQYLFRESHDQFLAIKKMIHVFKEDTSPGMIKKGDIIEAAVLSVPLIERPSIADGKTNSQRSVLNAMKSEQVTANKLEAFVAFKDKFAKLAFKSDDSQIMGNVLKK